jgi:hypothetical protein
MKGFCKHKKSGMIFQKTRGKRQTRSSLSTTSSGQGLLAMKGFCKA